MARSMVTKTGPAFGSPRWAGDYMGRDNLIPGGAKVVAAAFAADDAVTVTIAAAGALAGAVSIPVDALSGPIPFGQTLDFGAGKFARTTEPAASGAVAIAVEPLLAALVDNDDAIYAGTGTRYIPSGTIVGRTLVERDAGTGFGPADDADDEIYLSAFDVTDADDIDEIELYRPNNVVYENFLPAFAGASAAVKAAVRALYRCSINTPEA